MYKPAFRLRSFETIADGHKFAVLKHLLEALTVANIAYLLEHPHTPNLYESGVRYEEEPPNRDEWQDIPDTISRRTGDCEDLASWRVAELRVRGGEPRATHAISVAELPNSNGEIVTTYHIRVLRQDGTLEDPSRKLGMS